MPAWGGTPSPNPFYSTSNPYGWNDLSFPTTPIAKNYIQTEPGVAWTRAISGWGGGLDPFGRFVQGQEQRVNDAYMAAVTQNPNLQRADFYSQFGPEYFANLWSNIGARGRGEQNGLYNPRARWQRLG